MHRVSLIHLIIAAVLLLTLEACVGINGLSTKTMDEESLRDRVAVKWEARKNNNWAAIYDLTTKEFQKNQIKEQFGVKSNTTAKDHTIKSIEIDTVNKIADVDVSYTLNHMGLEFPFTSSERWIWERGKWRFEPKPKP